MRDMIHETPLLLAAAMMAHEANRAYCTILGDDSQVPWDEASQAQKDSIQAGVIAINENPDLSPEASHERWLERKEREGWAYGAEKSEEHMTHPCFMPYDALSDEHKFKDSLFGAVVRSVLFGISGNHVVTEAGQCLQVREAGDERGLYVIFEQWAASLMVGGPNGESMKREAFTAVMMFLNSVSRDWGTPHIMTITPQGKIILFSEEGTGPTYIDGSPVEDYEDWPVDEEDEVKDEESPRTALAEAGRVVDAGEVRVKQVMGAANYGDGLMIFFTDGSVQRWTRQGGWKAGTPVPETFAAHLESIKADLATDSA